MNECTVRAIVVTVIGCYWQSNECEYEKEHIMTVYL